MALHTTLPIYKVAYDLLDTITDLSRNMPRDFKASIGGKLRDECVEIVVLIFRAEVLSTITPVAKPDFLSQALNEGDGVYRP